MKYINTTRDKTTSDFARVNPSVDGSTLHFLVKTARPMIVGTSVPMVTGSLRLAVPAPVTSCDPSACSGEVTESVTLQFNIKAGNSASLVTLRAELNRVFDAAVASYNLADGIVPPATADFASE